MSDVMMTSDSLCTKCRKSLASQLQGETTTARTIDPRRHIHQVSPPEYYTDLSTTTKPFLVISIFTWI